MPRFDGRAPDEMRPITFDNELARDRDDVVLAHLGHRLLQMCVALLRAVTQVVVYLHRQIAVRAHVLGVHHLTEPAFADRTTER